MKLQPTALPEVVVIEPRVFEDDRGFLLETYSREKFLGAGISCDFVQDNHSFSRQGVLRGLHYQVEQMQAKLVYVIRGRVLDVTVDIRQGSPSFGRWVMVELSAENRKMIFIPDGFAHGFFVLEDADFIYKCSNHYRPEHQRGLLWSSPGLAIDWPDRDPDLSPRDAALPRLDQINAEDLPIWDGHGGALT